jgi:hypothetical protein
MAWVTRNSIDPLAVFSFEMVLWLSGFGFCGGRGGRTIEMFSLEAVEFVVTFLANESVVNVRVFLPDAVTFPPHIIYDRKSDID